MRSVLGSISRLVLIAAVAAVAGGAWAQPGPLSFSVTTRGGVKTARVQPVDRNGVLYVPLGALVSQVGGGYKMTPDRVQIDLAEKSAWLRSNNTQVSASLGIFVLGAPVVQSGNDVLIAASDVAVFFEKAFRLAANQQAPAAPAAHPPAPPVQPLEPEPQALEPLGTEPPDEAPVKSLEPLVKQVAVETLPAPVEGPTAPAPEVTAPPGGAPDAAENAPVPAGKVPGEALTARPEAREAPVVERPVDRPVAVVIIDPGHGGNDAGCQGPAGVTEAAVVFAVAEKLQQALEQGSPLKTVLTRDKERSVPRTERVFVANGRKGDLLISLHTGAALSAGQQGCRLFVCGPAGSFAGAPFAERSRQIAAVVAAGIAEATGRGSGGIYQLGCHVVQEAAMPGLMIELGMLTNPEEEQLLASEDYQAKLAGGIAAGIKKYMEVIQP
ncbi:MAG: N-acetylmuramoyl-L-alanine amidase [Candidatus Hydrogenedentes bacterium]|nr:N-acetylmuramoyl-L-alanine amidase [Candidatus Hydrogenedentota bacterium]